MSAKAIREAKGKQLLSKYLSAVISPIRQATYATQSTASWESLVEANPWLLTEKLVVKPDQLIKRRGKLGLVLVNVDLEQAKSWIANKAEKEIMVWYLRKFESNFRIKIFRFKVGKASGILNNFIIEPFIAHTQQEEFYICIYSNRDGETILFHHEGGVDIGDVDSKALKLNLPIDAALNINELVSKLLINVANQKKKEYVL